MSETPPQANGGWDEARVARYITDKVEESLNTEYKSAGALDKDSDKAKIQITKDVSAMVNSAGGIIIYGLAEHPTLKHLAGKIDPVDRAKISKEWLEQVISQIQPRIVDLRVHPVPLASGPNDVVYVVEIPQGTTAHQAADKRYYRRYNFEAVGMWDYEIRDVMNRVKAPRLEIEMLPMATDERENVVYYITAWLVNSSESITANDVTIRIEDCPPAWDMSGQVWPLVRGPGSGKKFVFQYPLHPGEREVIAKWKAGNGTAPISTYIDHTGGLAHKPDLDQASFSGAEYRFRFRMFAKDQPAMVFDCQFSKEEMEKQILKRFQPEKPIV